MHFVSAASVLVIWICVCGRSLSRCSNILRVESFKKCLCLRDVSYPANKSWCLSGEYAASEISTESCEKISRISFPVKQLISTRAILSLLKFDKVTDPVFISQDVKNPRANLNETNQFVKELKNRKVPITYVVRQHDQITQDEQIEFYSQLETFFSENLKK